MARAWQGPRLRAPAVGARPLLLGIALPNVTGLFHPRNVLLGKAPDMSTDRRHPLPRTQTLCAAFFLFAPLAAIAQVGLGETKVTICHVPPGNLANLHEIVVGAAAVPGHLAHGDFLDGSRSEEHTSE